MQTADAVPIPSTRLALPEMPYMPVMRPLPFAGPKLSTKTLAAEVTPGDYLFEMGAGRAMSGWLTLADKSAKGYGTKGQAEAPVSYLNPSQSTVPATCRTIYLGVIAYPIIDQAKGYISLKISPAEWATYALNANAA
jgi:hypothetical protein